MNNKTAILDCCLISLFISSCAFAQSGLNETITIVTYYPSPHGVYGTLTLYPKDEEPQNPRQGDLYFDKNNENVMYFKNDIDGWQNLTGGGGVAGGWEYNTTTGHVHNVNTGHIGIGTTNPSEKLTIVGTATDPVRLEMRGPHPDFEMIDTQVPSAVQISNDGNLLEILKDNAGDPDFSSTSYLMVINIPSGNVGIGTTTPQQKLEVNGAVRLAPVAAPAAPPEGSMYYDSDQQTPAYHDGTQWNNFISEYGVVPVTGGMGTSYVTVNFRKTYTNPPIVIPVGNQKCSGTQVDDYIVTVFNKDVTNDHVEFDLDCADSDNDFQDSCQQDVEIQYIVIPR